MSKDLSKHFRNLLWERWSLDPDVVFLNHGSFGACPLAVVQKWQAMQSRMERQPMDFFVRFFEDAQVKARSVLADFVGAELSDLVFVPNATYGVNSVLRSLDFRPGAQILTTDHTYHACENALKFIAERFDVEIVVAKVPFPLTDPQQVIDAIEACVTPKTQLALLDHITSATALVLPLPEIIEMLSQKGVETLVDGAHAVGMMPLDLSTLGATYYTSNCHKWLCAPKGAAFLYVSPEKQEQIRPLSISHGADLSVSERSRFELEFSWTGTFDPSPWLCVPDAIEEMAVLEVGGWPAIMEKNRSLVLEGRSLLCKALGVDIPAPESMIGSIASIPLPSASIPSAKVILGTAPLQDRLYQEWKVEVPISAWPNRPHRLFRISAQLYNSLADYEHLADAFLALLR